MSPGHLRSREAGDAQQLVGAVPGEQYIHTSTPSVEARAATAAFTSGKASSRGPAADHGGSERSRKGSNTTSSQATRRAAISRRTTTTLLPPASSVSPMVNATTRRPRARRHACSRTARESSPPDTSTPITPASAVNASTARAKTRDSDSRLARGGSPGTRNTPRQGVRGANSPNIAGGASSSPRAWRPTTGAGPVSASGSADTRPPPSVNNAHTSALTCAAGRSHRWRDP